MAARWSDTRREPREDAGPGGTPGCLFVAFVLASAPVYVGVHVLAWIGRVIA